ncbi:MAG: hypothetical protein ACJATU_001073 [Rickettsiales bacterium]|jgi:hypothetical protein
MPRFNPREETNVSDNMVRRREKINADL